MKWPFNRLPQPQLVTFFSAVLGRELHRVNWWTDKGHSSVTFTRALDAVTFIEELMS